MPVPLFPVDEPAVSLNDHPRKPGPFRRASMWLAGRRWRRAHARATNPRPAHKPIDWWGVVQALGSGAFVFGTIDYFGVGLGLLIAGAAVFLAATGIEMMGGQ